ncbi:MAG: hypothetical protein ABFD75_01770 [Smithella sp.]
MKRNFFATILLSLILLFSNNAFADSGKVLFFDQNGQGSSFNSADIMTLGVKVSPTKSLRNLKFDYIQVIVSPSYNPKMEWRRGWMANEMDNGTLSNIILVPKSKLINGYGTPFMIEDIKEYPSAKGYETVTLNAKVKTFKKIGEHKETRWDKFKEKFITETIFEWDSGVQIASGSATFSVPKLSAEDKAAIDKDKEEKLKQLNAIRKKMGKPPLNKLP